MRRWVPRRPHLGRLALATAAVSPPASSEIADFTLLGPTASPVDLTPYFLVTTPQWYDASHITTTGFWLGGPGSGRC